MKIPGMTKNTQNLMDLWCQWCVKVGRHVPIEEWLQYAHETETHMVIAKVFSSKTTAKWTSSSI